jgi:hypothetical protein
MFLSASFFSTIAFIACRCGSTTVYDVIPAVIHLSLFSFLFVFSEAVCSKTLCENKDEKNIVGMQGYQ